MFQAVSRLLIRLQTIIADEELRLLSVKKIKCYLLFQFYKDQAISHCSYSMTVHLRGIQNGEKPEAVCALGTHP